MSYTRKRPRSARSTVQGLGRLGVSDLGGETDLMAPMVELPDIGDTTDLTPTGAPDPTGQLTLSDLMPPPPIRGTPPPVPPRRFAVGTLDGETPVPYALGGYLVTGMLASGAMGIVYRGHHPSTRTPVAIKVMRAKLQRNPADVARFFAEAVATSRIDHANVVRYYDFGHDAKGAAYLVMELLEGETLSSRLTRDRRLDIPTAVDITIQISLALAAAHQHGIVHRDIKPDNIFLSVDRAGAMTVKLLDFGVAKIDQGSQATRQGDLLGTPSYMAPEQGLSASSSDERSDLYAVGCILFEMVCGVVPFGGNLVETLLAHQTSPRPSARQYVPEISSGLEELIETLLARDPADRPQSVADVVRRLAVIRADQRLASGPPARAGTERIRHQLPVRWDVWIAGFIALGIVLGVVFALL